MEIISESTSKTPAIIITGNTLSIKGAGIPENSREYWDEITRKLKKCIPSIKKEHKNFILDLTVTYFNVSFSKEILDFFKFFEELNEPGTFEVRVIWNYKEDDDDMIEAGEDYQTIIKLPFKLKLIEETE